MIGRIHEEVAFKGEQPFDQPSLQRRITASCWPPMLFQGQPIISYKTQITWVWTSPPICRLRVKYVWMLFDWKISSYSCTVGGTSTKDWVLQYQQTPFSVFFRRCKYSAWLTSVSEICHVVRFKDRLGRRGIVTRIRVRCYPLNMEKFVA